ncbi:unnamed protein product [Urochloa humidicola]
MEIKIKMDKTAIIVSSVVGSLGLLAAILGFSAEGANSTGLGICAGIFLLVAQITVSAFSGRDWCNSGSIPSETKRTVAIGCVRAVRGSRGGQRQRLRRRGWQKRRRGRARRRGRHHLLPHAPEPAAG